MPEAQTARSRTSRNGAVAFTLLVFTVVTVAVLAVDVLVQAQVTVAGLAAAVVLAFLAANSVHVVMEWERAVIMRLGRFNRVAGPGVVFTIPLIEFCTIRVDQRVSFTYFGAEETFTNDLVPVNVDAVILWMVFSPKKAATEVEDYAAGVAWVSQTMLRKAIGRSSVAEVVARRDELDAELSEMLTEKLSDWGIDVIDVEIRDIVIPKDLQAAMAKESVAEREKNARLTLAAAEQDIAAMMADAAEVYGSEDAAMRLRTMHLAYESVKESGGTVVLPSSFSEGFVDSASQRTK